jgi:quercetin dioxygenase-like cupin family protein
MQLPPKESTIFQYGRLAACYLQTKLKRRRSVTMSHTNSIFQTATIITPTGEKSADRQEWAPHPVFPGVWMKHLVTGEDTGGLLSCHLVRIENGCEIGAHVHDASLELHEVLSGTGNCLVEGRDTEYQPGVCLVIPAGERHSVAAKGCDLHLMAKFTPALL